MKNRFTEEKIVARLREIESAGKPVPEACRAAGISVPTYYDWNRLHQGLQRDGESGTYQNRARQYSSSTGTGLAHERRTRGALVGKAQMFSNLP